MTPHPSNPESVPIGSKSVVGAETPVARAVRDAVTIAVAQTSLDAYSFARDGVMFTQLVRGAGFVPLRPKDRRVLAKGMGAERFAEFRKAIKQECSK